MPYHHGMDLSRDDLTALIAYALMRDSEFRTSRGRKWHETAEQDRARAGMVAGRIVEHLERCGVMWSKRPPAPRPRTPR